MALQHTRFMGASVANFSTSLGWNAEQSQFTVVVAEDTKAEGQKYDWSEYDNAGNLIIHENGVIRSTADLFSPPPIGYPAHFKISDGSSNYVFQGILQSWRKHNGVDGEIYEVTLIDPKHLLAGAKVIIDGYTGSVNNVPNLINAYGYLENIAYGYSRINEAGLPWNKLREALNVVVNSIPVNLGNAQFGGPIRFRGREYRLDLSELPSAPDYYRIQGGTSVSLLDIITQICEDASRDFYTKLVVVNGYNYIKVKTVSRRSQPSLNRIQQYLNSVENVILKNRGLELRAEDTSAFLVGEKVQQLYKQQYTVSYTDGRIFDLFGYTANNDININASLAAFSTINPQSNSFAQKFNNAQQEAINNTIWPYWGLDSQGNAIVGVGHDYYHSFYVDTRRLTHITGVGERTLLHVAELQAALMGEAEWINWLALYRKDRAKALGIEELFELTQDILEFEQGLEQMNMMDVLNLTAEKLLFLSDPQKMALIHQLYEFVYNIATEHYARKFMVKVPFVLAKIEDESVRMVTSYEPVDSAFLSESDWNNGIAPFNLPEVFWDLFQPSADGKFQAFVRFDNVRDFNLAELSPDDYVVIYENVGGQETTNIVTYNAMTDDLDVDEQILNSKLFLRCEIDPQLVFIDRANASDPRVVITLPGPLTPAPDSQYIPGVTKAVSDFCKFLEQDAKNANDQQKQEAFNRLARAIAQAGFTGEPGKYGAYPLFITPYYAAVPLKSNVLRYGPWYAVGAQGGVRYDENTTLAPWNFNGYSLMNETANALVSEAYSNMQIAELGDIEILGIPSTDLGAELIAGGPIITNIRCSVGTDGVTTNYNMETYKINPYGLNKQNYDRIQRLNTEMISLRKTILEQTRIGMWVEQSSQWNPALGRNDRRISKTKHTNSPHSTFLVGFFDGISGIYPTPAGHSLTQRFDGSFRSVTEMRDNLSFYVSPEGVSEYKRIAAGSLDHFLCPYSTDSGNPYLPRFTKPMASGIGNRSVLDLHPFHTMSGTDETHIRLITHGDSYPSQGLQNELGFDGEKVQSIGLRGPVIIAGWGYDINDKPVPNENPNSPTDKFAPGYRYRPDLWPAGPLDTKWDNNRKVWVAGLDKSIIGYCKHTISGVENFYGNNSIVYSGAVNVLKRVGETLVEHKVNNTQVVISGVFNYYSASVPAGTKVNLDWDSVSQTYFIAGGDCHV